MTRSLRIGLTGGIASGKSAAEQAFRALGVPVLDADQVARAVVEPGEPALTEIAAAFGPEVLSPDGRLDRRALRERVFADTAARHRLEGITHPRIMERIDRWLNAQTAPYCVLSAALMVGGASGQLVDRVLVIDAPEALQRARLMQRDQVAAELAERMIAAQLPRQQRLAAADDVIVNDASPEQLLAAVQALHQRYLATAAASAPSPDQHED